DQTCDFAKAGVSWQRFEPVRGHHWPCEVAAPLPALARRSTSVDMLRRAVLDEASRREEIRHVVRCPRRAAAGRRDPGFRDAALAGRGGRVRAVALLLRG